MGVIHQQWLAIVANKHDQIRMFCSLRATLLCCCRTSLELGYMNKKLRCTPSLRSLSISHHAFSTVPTLTHSNFADPIVSAIHSNNSHLYCDWYATTSPISLNDPNPKKLFHQDLSILRRTYWSLSFLISLSSDHDALHQTPSS
jgi:hypothetical protein